MTVECPQSLILVVLGIGGAWGSRLVALAPYQRFFLAGAVFFFGLAFYQLYRRQPACTPGESCAVPPVRRRQRVIFWLVVIVAAGLVSFPVYAPLFL